MKIDESGTKKETLSVGECELGQVYLNKNIINRTIYMRSDIDGRKVMVNLKSGLYSVTGEYSLLPNAILFPYGQ